MTYHEFRSNLLSLIETELPGLFALCRPYRWESLETVFRRRLDLHTSLPTSTLTVSGLCECLTEDERDLFLALCRERTGMAREASVPPYIICSNRALYEMCVRQPLDLDALKKIHGIGEKNAASHGDRFLAVIREHAASHPVSSSVN